MPKKYISETRMKRYFSHQHTWRYAALLYVLGIICIVLVYVPSFTIILYQYFSILLYTGAIALLGGTIILLVFYIITPSDKEFDTWLVEQQNRVAARVLTKLNLDQTQVIAQPLLVHGFVRYGSDLAKKDYNNNVYSKIGKDGIIRFSVNTLLFFFPAEHHIAAFYTDINAIEQSLRHQESAHYYYHDIVGLTANDEQLPLPFYYRKARLNILFQEFALNASNGDSVGTSVLIGTQLISDKDLKNQPPFITDVLGGKSEVDQTIASLLMLLRAKKQTSP